MAREINICMLVIYFIIAYGGDTCHYFDLTQIGYLLQQQSENLGLYMPGTTILHCIVIGWLADSYFGKFQVFVFTLLFMALSLITLVVCVVDSLDISTRRYFYLASRLLNGMYVTFGGLLYVILMEQLDLPEQLSDVSTYTFIYFELLLIASFMNECLSAIESPQFTFSKLVFIIVILGIASVIMMKFHPLIRVEPVYFNIIESCLQASYFAIGKAFFKKEFISPTIEEETSGNQGRVQRVSITHGHWIYRAQYLYPDVILESTERFLRQISVLTFSAAFFCFYSLNISTMSIQANLIGRTFHAKLQLTLPAFLKLLKILFLPVTEYILIPILRACTIFKRDLHYIGIGFFFLLISILYSTYLQITLQRHSFALPASGAGQLRIYNSLPEQVNLTTQHNETLQIKPYSLLSILRLYGKGRISRRFTLQSPTVNQTRYLNTHSGQSFTSVVTGTGFSQTDRPDALFYFMLMTNISNLMFTTVLLVHREKRDGFIVLAGSKTEFYVMRLNPKLYQPFVLIRAGKYHVTYRDNILQQFHKLNTNAEFSVGGIYSLFIYRNTTGDLAAKVFTIMHPIIIHWKYLLPQVIFAVLAYCFASLSWLKFTFLEAPIKLRTSSFCYGAICGEIFTNVISLESNFLNNVHYADTLYLSIGFLLSSWVLFIYFAANYKYVEWKDTLVD